MAKKPGTGPYLIAPACLVVSPQSGTSRNVKVEQIFPPLVNCSNSTKFSSAVWYVVDASDVAIEVDHKEGKKQQPRRKNN